MQVDMKKARKGSKGMLSKMACQKRQFFMTKNWNVTKWLDSSPVEEENILEISKGGLG